MKLTEKQKDEIAEKNMKLVHYVVGKFKNSGMDAEELFSIGVVGFAKALNTFETDKGVKLSTYAINCIRNEILFIMRKEKKNRKNNISMSMIISEDKNGNGLTLEDTIAQLCSNELSVEDRILLDEDISILNETLSTLTEKERYILTYRFGLGCENRKTQKEIADHVGMSQANISKLERGIVKKCTEVFKKMSRN